MAVSSTTNKVSYTASGSSDTFAYNFRIYADADLNVYVGGVLKTLTTDYTVTDAGEDQGNVVFETNPTSGDKVVIERVLTLTQGTDYVENDPFPAESHEDALDRLTFITQQQQEVLDRSFKYATTVTDAGTVEISDDVVARSNRVLAFDSSGNPFSGPTVGDLETIEQAAADIALLADIQDGTTTTNSLTILSENIDDVQTVAAIGVTGLQGIVDNEDNIGDVAGQITPTNNIATVASRDTDIGIVALRDADIGIVADRDLDVGIVADRDLDVGIVATNIASVNAVSADITKVVEVADDLLEVVAGVVDSEIETVADSIGNVNIVGNVIGNVNTVAGISGDVTTVSTNNLKVTNLYDNMSAIQACDTNMTSITGAVSEASDAAASATLSSNWATQMVGTVDGSGYSAKYWANEAESAASGGISLNGLSNVDTTAGLVDNSLLQYDNVTSTWKPSDDPADTLATTGKAIAMAMVFG
ncbi:MAG: hypothetical protein NZ824_12295 [Candidatus Thioglobus sp.]|nr:hypothetical protein [Candidatus Thioglobus sp.]